MDRDGAGVELTSQTGEESSPIVASKPRRRGWIVITGMSGSKLVLSIIFIACDSVTSCSTGLHHFGIGFPVQAILVQVNEMHVCKLQSIF